MSKDLKKRGMTFVGPTITYAFMQSAGLTNDHQTTCYRHQPSKDMAGILLMEASPLPAREGQSEGEPTNL
jgi:DNA-3-methyladenine glycosylase I